MKKIVIFLILVPFIVSPLQGAEASNSQQQARTYSIKVTFVHENKSKRVEHFPVCAGIETQAFFEQVEARACEYFPGREFCIMKGKELFPQDTLQGKFLAKQARTIRLVVAASRFIFLPGESASLVMLVKTPEALARAEALVAELQKKME